MCHRSNNQKRCIINKFHFYLIFQQLILPLIAKTKWPDNHKYMSEPPEH